MSIFIAGYRNHVLHRVAAIVLRAAVTFAVGFSAVAGAANLPAHVHAEMPDARLAEQADFRWFGLKIYTAELWVGDAGYRAAALSAGKFALDLRYARAPDSIKIAESSRDEMQRLGLGTPQQLQSWFLRMTGLFPNVPDGTRITGVYLPDAGARFYLDGKRIGDVADAEFGRAFFAIWLDPDTSAPALREALLQNAAPK
jgi:hypothetical protein